MTQTESEERTAVRSRIVEAAAGLLRAGGSAAVTTRSVAEHAAVQPPTIYRIFGDKDGLLDAVAEFELGNYVASKTPPQDDADPVDELRAGWRDHITFGLAHPALFGYLNDPARAGRSPAARAGQDVLRARVRRVAAAGRLRIDEQRAVDLIHAAGTGAVLTLLSKPPQDRDPQLTETMLDAVLFAVVADAPAASADPVAAAAITMRAALPDLPDLSKGERALLGEWLDRVGTR